MCDPNAAGINLGAGMVDLEGYGATFGGQRGWQPRYLINFGHLNWFRLGFAYFTPERVAHDNGLGDILLAHIDGNDVRHPIFHVIFTECAPTETADAMGWFVTMKT